MQILNAADESYKTLWTDEEKKYYDQFPVTILNDLSCLLDDTHDDFSFAWLNESPDIIEYNWEMFVLYSDLWKEGDKVSRFYPAMVEKLKTGDHKFKTLYTHDRRYEGLSNVKIVRPATPSYINTEHSKVYKKKNDLVFVTSNKYVTPLHRLRVDLLSPLIAMNVPCFGQGINPIKNKVKALKDYRFCLVIENGVFSGYHTEKIIDCFRTGTIPIYLGDPDIGDIFDEDGIIKVTQDDLKDIGSFLMNFIDPIMAPSLEEFYMSKLEHVKNNFETSMAYDNHPKTVIRSILKEEGFIDE